MIKALQFLLVRICFALSVAAFIVAYMAGGMAADTLEWIQPARKLWQIRARPGKEDKGEGGIEALQKGAEAGDIDAQCALSMAYYSGKGVAEDKAEAVKWCRRAAEQGNVVAQFNLGVSYEHGIGVAENKTEAVKWYRHAAEKGKASAQFNLGCAYYDGEGVAEDKAEAVKWYRRAAEKGTASAQHNLGVMHDKGEGVTQDYREAYIWYSIAAANGQKESAKNRDFLANKLPPTELLAAQAEATKRRADIQEQNSEKE